MRIVLLLGIFGMLGGSVVNAENANVSQSQTQQVQNVQIQAQQINQQNQQYQQMKIQQGQGMQSMQQMQFIGNQEMLQIEDIEDIHRAIDGYAKEYANLRPIDGKRPDDPKLVQLCLLLDTSNSMDGLINQAKSQLWTIVNELSKAQKDEEGIRLQVALYEYGNDGLSLTTGYIRQVTAFTEDLDLLSEALFALKTNGGSEYCGHVIGASLNGLKWNTSKEGLKMIYIAGNEPFHQGPVNFKATCGFAAERMVVVNTIHCGDYQTGINTSWQMGATIGNGSYFAIDSDKVTEGIPSPYDDELIRLNGEMNKTYVPYGSSGKQNLMRQSVQDTNAAQMSKSNFAGRAVSKGSSLYKSSSWDLVDAIEENTITIDKVKRDQLPEELQNKTDEELKAYVENKNKERKDIKSQIADLSKKRADFIQEQRAQEEGDKSLGSVILESLHNQAETQNFGFKE
ncbi:MAG: hypothetical protein KAS92_01905 [Candidatus Omnitrophica bacterium]|nr:hypothetical protein [Candidatus Omnitrophota bacterium]